MPQKELNFFPTNLQFLRKKKGLTQSELAKQIGVDQTTIGRWEDGNREPTVGNVVNLASVLNIEIPDLISKNLCDNEETSNTDGIYIQKADGTSVFLKNASGADKALVELPEEQKKAILAMIGKTMEEIDKKLDGE